MSGPPIHLLPRRLDERSGVTCSAATVTIDGCEVLVLAFTGAYRDGSEGRPDARRMYAEALAAIAHWEAEVVVFDLRGLSYRWGDGMIAVLGVEAPGATAPVVSAVVVGEHSRVGLTSLCRADSLFEDLEVALREVVARARAERAEQDRVEDALTLVVVLRDDLGPADAATGAGLAVIVAREHFEDTWQMRLWVTGVYRLLVVAADPDTVAWAGTLEATRPVKDPARGFAPVGVVLCPRAEVPARLLALRPPG